MDASYSETDRPIDSAEPVDRQSKFDPARDSENQRRAWANLGSIEAGLDSIADGIHIAEEYNLNARNCLEQLEHAGPELEQEAGRSQPEVEIAGNAQGSEQQSRQLDDRRSNFEHQRQQIDDQLEL